MVDVSGAAIATATVTVNGQSAYRKGEFFRQTIAVNNATGAVWQAVTVTASGQGTVTGHVFVPQTPETYTYDNDGNLLTDGRWTYTWDGWNRLVTMTANVAGTTPQALVFEYDWQGRRIRKQVWNTDPMGPSDSTAPDRDVTFLYDGWELLAELNSLSTPALQRSYLWGADLDGTLGGAGGVGGLVAVNDVATLGSLSTHFPACDGNGDVAALVNAANGNISGQYEYGAFADGSPEGTLRVSWPMGVTNHLRFSTKYQDDESGLVYYGERYYHPGTGRWLGRDPIAEEGGLNLFGFVGNSPANDVDPTGTDDMYLLRSAKMPPRASCWRPRWATRGYWTFIQPAVTNSAAGTACS